MIYRQIRQLSSIKRSKIFTAVFTAFLTITCLSNQAQNLHFQFNNTPLSEALLLISGKLKLNIAYDTQKLSSVFINKEIKGDNDREVLKTLLENTGFTFQFKHESYLIIPVKGSKTVLSGNNQNQIVAVILDKETGENIPYANVFAENEKMNISSSTNGTFSLKNVSDSLHLKISYLGYYTLDTIIKFRGSILNSSFQLSKKSLLLNAVDVNAEKLKMIECSKDAGHMTINPLSFSNFPNLGETDVFRTLQLLPGISFNEKSSELNIRGGSGDQNLVLFDGFTLYNLDHFFGSFSSINPNVVKDIQVYKGGYDSRYGERVSGIIDITGKSGNQIKPSVYGGFNLIDGNLTIELPFSKKFTVIAAGRRTYNNLYSTYLFEDLFKSHFGKINPDIPPDALEIKPKYYFYDYNTKASYSISNKEKVTFSLYGGEDYLNNSNDGDTKPFSVKTVDTNKWQNFGLSGSWLKQWNEGYFSNLQIGYSGYSNNYFNNTNITRELQNNESNIYLPKEENTFETTEQNELKDFSLSMRNTYLYDLKNQLDFGFQVRNNWFSYSKNADNTFIYNDLKQADWLYSLFFQDRFNPTPKFTLKPGIRLNYDNSTNDMYLEPRLSISYNVSDALLFKAATGRYYQYLSKVQTDQQYGYNRDFWVIADNIRHPVISSNHFIVGTSLKTNNFFIDIEAYYKSVNGLQEYLFVSQYLKNSDFNYFFPKDNGLSERPQPSVFITGSGKSYGIDLLLRYERNYYSNWISYSLGKTQQNFSYINQNNAIPSSFDQRHELNWVHMLSLNKWNFSLLYLFSTGQPYIESSKTNRFFQTTRVYKRLPDYQRVDVSANYNLKIKKLNFTIGASIINVLNINNYYDIYTRQFDFDNNNFETTTLIKSQDFTPNFYINFHF